MCVFLEGHGRSRKQQRGSIDRPLSFHSLSLTQHWTCWEPSWKAQFTESMVKIWFLPTSSLPCCVSLKGSVVLHVRTCVRALCKVNYRHATCKLCVTCKVAATLYGEHSILVRLDLAKHSGSRGERVWLCLREYVCMCFHDRGGVTKRREESWRGKKVEEQTQKSVKRRSSKWKYFTCKYFSWNESKFFSSLQGFFERWFPGISFSERFLSVQIEWL